MTTDGKPQLLATVFSDYICPFCYVGDVRLDRLRDDYDLRINWCFLEIHPETPSTGMDTRELGYTDERWTLMMDNLARLADEEGISFRAHSFTTNSRRALLLAEAARSAGAAVFYRLHRRLFEAFFSDGLNIGDTAVLESLAVDAGVPATLIEQAWTDPRYEARLRLYSEAARELDVRATPTIFFGEQQRIDGALSLDVFRRLAAEAAAAQHEG